VQSTTIESRQAPWRQLSLGSTVWAPFREHGWRPGIVTSLGKNRGDNTAVYLRFETGGKGQGYAGELWWRKPELKGEGQAKVAKWFRMSYAWKDLHDLGWCNCFKPRDYAPLVETERHWFELLIRLTGFRGRSS